MVALLLCGWSATATAQLTEPVNTTSPIQIATVTLSASGTLGAIGVFTQGAVNLDFNAVSGAGTCTVGNSYTAGQSCTVDFTFTPTRPGLRYGGITLTSSTGVLLGNAYAYGVGVGPQVIFSPAIQSLLGSGFSQASGVAVDGNGNIFVSNNTGNGLYEIVTATNTVRAVGSFLPAQDVAVDGSGNVFVISNRTTVSEVLAVNGSVPASPTIITIYSGFDELNGMKVDGNGNVFVANGYTLGSDSAIYEMLAVNGSIPTSNATILSYGSGFLSSPTGVAVDASGDIFVSDENNSAVYEMLAVNGSVPTSNPTIRTLGSGFGEPTNVALDDNGNVFVPDYGNHAVYEIVAVNGSVPANNPTILTLGSGFYAPQGVYIDGGGNVYVADYIFTQIVEVGYAGPSALSFATTDVGSTSSDSPKSVTMMNNGNAALTFSVPGSGSNPAISAGFSVNNTSTCPQLAAGGTVATLAAGSSCTDAVNFTPVAPGPDNGTLVITDDNLDVPGAMQTVQLNGNALLIPTIVFTVPNHTYGDAPFPVMATSNSPGAITYSVVSGPATISGNVVTLTGAGTVTLEASQAASGEYDTGSQDATFNVAKAAQTITFPPPASPVNYGSAPITLSASASSGLPVIFSILSGPATLSGNTLTFTGLGTVVIAADQAGNANYNAAPEVTQSILVIGAVPAISISAGPNPVFLLNPVTFSVTLSSPTITPAGTVTFYDGSTALGTTTLAAGTATLTVSTLAMGTHSITAAYSGGYGFIAVTSPAVSELVEDFNLNIVISSQTIPHGGAATYTLTLTPISGPTMPAAISFAVTGEPDTSTITFTPQTVAAGSGAATVMLAMQTPDYPVGPWNVSRNPEKTALALIALGGLLLPFARRRRILGVFVLLLALTVTLGGCGSGWKTQTFSMGITASSGPLAHTATATLISSP